MSKIQFNGWLKTELKRMSVDGSLNLRSLAAWAQTTRPRIATPLLAYAIENDVVEQLVSYIHDQNLLEEYTTVLSISGGKSLDSLDDQTVKQLPWNYRKLLKTWESAKYRTANRTASKELRLARSLALKEEKGIRNAQIYSDLGLNKGNINAYFKDRDVSKVSLETATRIMEYLHAC
jgi:hypothetical protein